MTSLLIPRHLVPRLAVFVFAIIVLVSDCAREESQDSLGPHSGMSANNGPLNALSALSSCKVKPSKFTLVPQKKKQFSVIGYRSDGTSATEPASYTATGGTISGSGLYTSGSATGTFAVNARLVGTTIKCKATVIVATLTALQATPDPVTLSPSGGQQFSAVGHYSDASTGAVTVGWSTPSATNGTVSSSGNYGAPAVPGKYKVIAKVVGGTLADTAVVTVTAAPPPSQAFPNQPAGYQQFFRYTAASLPSAGVGGGSQGGNDGAIWRYDPRNNMSLVTDATAPHGPSSVFRLAFLTGLGPGDSPGLIQMWETGNEINSTAYSEFYESTWIRVGDSNGFLTQQVGVKMLGYWAVGGRGDSHFTPSEIYSLLPGNGLSAQVMTEWHLDMVLQGIQDRRMGPNAGTSLFKAGRWQHLEVNMKVNTPSSASNGVLKIWLDGILTHNYTDVVFRTPAHPSGFYAKRWDPIWGGSGGGNRTRTDYLYIDDIYLSGKL